MTARSAVGLDVFRRETRPHGPTRTNTAPGWASRTYRMHGYVVSSDLDLLLPEVVTDEVPEVILQRSCEPFTERLPPAPDRTLATIWQPHPGLRYFLRSTPQGYLLHFDGLAEFEISNDLSEVTWKAADDCDPGLVPSLTAGTLMAFRLALADRLVLHASVVRARGRGLAFVGGSGMGKSTIATLLCLEGAELLTDDIARIELDGGNALVWPGCTETRLRAGATSLLPGGQRRARSTVDGRTAVSLPCWAGPPIPLDAIVIPVVSLEHQTLRLERATPIDALMLLSQFPRIAGWTDDRIRTEQFARFADLAKAVPVHLAALPWGPPFPGHLGAGLLDELGWT